MDEVAPKDDDLWGFIARDLWTGVVAYLVVLVTAFLFDVFRKTSFSRSPLTRTLSRSRLSPASWHRHYLTVYRDTKLFYIIEVFRLAINLAVCVIYVIGTYKRNVPTYISIINRVSVSFFILDLASQILAAESAITFASSLIVFFDAFSLPSLIMASGPNAFLNFSFLRSIQAYVAFSRLEKRLLVQVFSSKRHFAKLAMQCITLFYGLACGIQLLEIPGDLLPVSFRDTWLTFGEWNFFNSVYFVIVTLSTVGYGDFSPATIQGRIFTLMIIVIGIVIFTTVVGEIVERSSRRRGSGWFIKNPDTRHVIVTGNPTLADLVLFVSEFYADQRESNINAKLVVMVENPTWTDSDWFQHIAKNSFLQSRLTFLIGCLRNPIDTQRARLSSADAVFFLTSPSAVEDPCAQDTATVMNILAVRNMRTDVPIYAQTLQEESNLQTTVALSTPTSYDKGTYYRNTKVMRRNASYAGLFHSILLAELQDLPRAHLRKGRQTLQDIHQHFSDKQEQEDAIASGRKSTDLERSHLICLQETHMALIAGNIKVNGLATLLSNMYLDVQAGKPSAGDPSWLWEYHMGAACSLRYAVIPEKLHGVSIKEIAVELFHVGLVLVATSDTGHITLHPVLDTDMPLRKGDIGMFLTYHSQDYVAAALYLVTGRYQMGELRHPLLPSSSSGDDLAGFGVRLDSANPTHATSARSGTNQRQYVRRYAGAEAAKPSYELNGPSVESESRCEQEAQSDEDILGGNLMATEKGIANEKCSDGYMPDQLRGHLIVAMEGDAPLDNLRLFLKMLWQKDNRRSTREARRARVVIVHPSISDQYRETFSRHDGKSLFFVQGLPSAAETWKRAKLRTAKSVITMADYTQPWNVTDARTIFTLLTLDVNTAADHDVFICSELVDEKSLEFLREPTHARRRGAMLGEGSLPSLPVVPSSQQLRSPITSSAGSPPPPIDGTGTVAVSSREQQRAGQTAPRRDRSSSPSSSPDGGQVSQPVRRDSSDVLRPVNDLLPSMKKSKGFTGRTSPEEDQETSKSVREKDAKLLNSSKPDTEIPNKVNGKEETGVDPADKPGAARARRGSLFSRSRYASGELLIHSSAITLIVREYIEPGFANFYADLLGTRPPALGLKIRLVRIPKSFFTPGKGAIFKNDLPLIPYIAVFQSLMRHGATPLGIYRSGDAPALIPCKSRQRRGHAIMEELEPHWKRFEAEDGSPPAPNAGNFFGSLFGLVQGVTPQKMREARGRDEINGIRESPSTSDDYDTDSDSDNDNGVGKEAVGINGKGAAGADPTASAEVGNEHAKATSATPPRTSQLASKLFGNNDELFEVPGSGKYRERAVAQNLLPYVFTMPDPNTLCAETDGIYILCHPSLELSEKWTEDVANKNDNDS